MPRENQRDSVRDLTAFVAVARELNFTRAAVRLGISQSALSYTIKMLEQRLGVRLLTRSTRSVGLTEAGQRLLDTAAGHLDGIDQALAGLASFRDQAAGTVRIAASDHAAATVLHPALGELLQHHPGIRFELLVDNGFTDIVSERCDAGIRLGEHLARDMVAARISPPQRMAVVASPAYFERYSQPQTPEDLTLHNCLGYRLETHGSIYAWEFEKSGKQINIRPQGQVVSNNPIEIKRFCLSGNGIACMQESYFTDEIADGRLQRVLEDWCESFDGYFIYYPSRRQPTAAFRLVLQELRRHAG